MTSSEPIVCPHCGRVVSSPRAEETSCDARAGIESPVDAAASNFDLPAADPFLLALADEEQGGSDSGIGRRPGASGSSDAPRFPMSTVVRSEREESTSSSGSRSVEMLRIDLRPKDAPRDRPSSSHRPVERAERAGESVSGSSSGEFAIESRRSTWILLLVSSYASALTLAMGWFVVLPRLTGKSKTSNVEAIVKAMEPSEAGSRGGQSRRVEPVATIPEDHRTSTGKPLVIGSLEITPIGAFRKPIHLLRNRLIGGVERKEEPGTYLMLQFRLRNVSNDLIFAPFDESFVRDRESGISDSFVEFGPNVRVYPYPLAPRSEWSIEGQSFRELKPGETMETIFVTSQDAERLTAESLLWRLRLRTGLEQSELVGVTTDVPPP